MAYEEGRAARDGRLIADRYRLLGRLGRGGMGTVWRAEDELLHRRVALKEVHLRDGLSAEELEQQRQRTLREAQAVAQVRHPAVVGVLDVLRHDGDPWIVMELVEGDSLAARLRGDGPLPAPETARIGLAVLGALRAAHACGVLHRDVKPDNVLLERGSDRVVLVDFGIARIDDGVTLTEPGCFLGSPEFTAPERVEDGRAGPESDLWSLGVLLCAALDGRSPFHRDSLPGVLHAVLSDEIVIPPSAEPLAPLLAGLLRRDPAERLDAAEAERLLRQYLDRPSEGAADRTVAQDRTTAQEPPTAVAVVRAAGEQGAEVPAGAVEPVPDGTATVTGDTPAPPQRPRRRIALLAGAVVAACAVGATGAALLAVRPAPTRPAPAPTTTASADPAPTSSPSVTGSPALPAADSTSPAVAPAGSSIRRDPAGFSLAVPDGWVRSTDASGRVFYLSPDHTFRIGVHPSTPSGRGVLADLQQQDADGPHTNPGYRSGSVQPTVFHGTSDAAVWLWTWNGYPDDGFGARRVQDISWTEQARTYDFWVSAPTGRLDQADRYFQAVSATFRIG